MGRRGVAEGSIVWHRQPKLGVGVCAVAVEMLFVVDEELWPLAVDDVDTDGEADRLEQSNGCQVEVKPWLALLEDHQRENGAKHQVDSDDDSHAFPATVDRKKEPGEPDENDQVHEDKKDGEADQEVKEGSGESAHWQKNQAINIERSTARTCLVNAPTEM